MGKIRIGIIGCGGIANNKHMPSLAQLENVEMVAFCDIELDKAIEAGAKYGGEAPMCCDDYKELLKLELDGVHVCTPNNSHSEISVAALKSGKHVMCEKPMAKTSKGALAMVEAARETGKILTIGYQNRFRVDSMYLKRASDNGDFGEVYFAKAHALRRRAVPTWGVFLKEEEQGGGPLIDIGTHALDLTLWCMDNYEALKVSGSVYHKLGDLEEPANAFGDWDPEEFSVEDSAFGFITMKNGATIILESSWALNTLDGGEAQTTLCGTKAGADMKDGLRINGSEYNKLYVKKPALDAAGVDFFDGEGDDPALLEAKSFIDNIVNNTKPVVEPEQAYIVTRILEAIYESAKTGKEVFL